MTARKSSTSKQSTDMQRLADLAGVSRATVSRALNDSPLINEKTKQRIRALAKEHNYVMNEMARGFRLKKTNIVSVVLMLDTGSGQHLSDAFFLEMLGHIADGLSDAGYDLLLCHEPISSAEDFVASRVYGQAEGIIFIGQGGLHEELNKLATSGKPVIAWGAPLPKRSYRVVGSDNSEGGYLSASHLLSQGCSRVAFFGDKQLPEIGLRYEGYCRALREAGQTADPALELAVPFESRRAEAVINEFLRRSVDINGIVCCSDLIAMSAIACLTRVGRRVPEDVAVVGYDDIELAARVNPSLSTISQDIAVGGKALVEKLMRLISGRRVQDAIAPARLVVRASSQRNSP